MFFDRMNRMAASPPKIMSILFILSKNKNLVNLRTPSRRDPMHPPTWHHILRTAIVGTERGPLPAGTAQSFGLNAHHDPAHTALETLTAAALMRKAGRRTADGTRWTADGASEPSAVHRLPSAVSRPPSAAALLDEWLGLVAQHRLRIAPEYLPELLDSAERNLAFWEKLHPALDPRGTWLAAQNPVWQDLVAPSASEGDWFTAPFPARMRMLADVRRHRPLVALAWLENTWPEESANHRLAFLSALRTGLSGFDEDFLEKNLSAKSLDLRCAAAELLAALPDSHCCTTWRELARHLARFAEAADLAAFLAEKIPDIEAALPAQLFALTDGKLLRSARQSILQTLLRLLHPTDWGFETKPRDLLSRLLDHPELDSALPALLEASARHRDPTWAADWLRFLNERPEHPLWRSQHLYRLLADTDDPALLQLACFQRHLLADGSSALSRALADRQRAWPALLVEAVLAAWAHFARNGPAYPSTALRAVLDRAALHCLPAEAETLCQRLLPSGSELLPTAWEQGWEAFRDVVRLRRKMWEEIDPTASV